MHLRHGLGRIACFPLLLALAAAGCSKSSTNPVAPVVVPASEFYVDAAAGSDSAAGTSGAPFRTLTHALAAAGPDAFIHVAAGRYDSSTGEVFPLVLQAGQTLVGDTLAKQGAGPSAPVIDGIGPLAGTWHYWTGATFVGAEGATLAGVRIAGAYTLFAFGVVSKDAGLTVAKTTLEGQLYGGIALEGAGASTIRQNVVGTKGYGMYLWLNTDSLVVRGNAFTTCSSPIDMVLNPGRLLVQGNDFAGTGSHAILVELGAPRIEGNVFDPPNGQSTHGAIWCQNTPCRPVVRGCTFRGARAVNLAPGFADLGTETDPGGNDFGSVTGVVVAKDGAGLVSAIGNLWPHDPPVAGADIVVSNGGSVRWGTAAGEIVQ